MERIKTSNIINILAIYLFVGPLIGLLIFTFELLITYGYGIDDFHVLDIVFLFVGFAGCYYFGALTAFITGVGHVVLDMYSVGIEGKLVVLPVVATILQWGYLVLIVSRKVTWDFLLPATIASLAVVLIINRTERNSA